MSSSLLQEQLGANEISFYPLAGEKPIQMTVPTSTAAAAAAEKEEEEDHQSIGWWVPGIMHKLGSGAGVLFSGLLHRSKGVFAPHLPPIKKLY